MSNSNVNLNQEGYSPLDKGKKPIEELLDKYKTKLQATNFLSSFVISEDLSSYLLPSLNKTLFQRWNRTFVLEKKKNKLVVKLIANFVVKEVKECTEIYNDKSEKKPLKYYMITIENDNGKIEKDIEVANNCKADVSQFQSHINSRCNGFMVCMNEAEFKTFVSEYIAPNVIEKATIYTNAGRIDETSILYENALARPNEILWVDKDGFIKTGENTFVKLKEATHYLPRLAKSNKTGSEIAKELLTNLLESWQDDIALPLISLGHMVMSFYFEDFIKSYGCPTLILFGSTGTGKSTLVTTGLSIFGLSRDALTSGGSTAKSNEYFTSKYNSLNVCIDDVKGDTLNSPNFVSLIKSIYKGLARTRMLPYGKGVEYIKPCSPLAYSTNEALPELQEVINRMNVIEIFGKIFQPDKFKYHEVDNEKTKNLEELSLILPEFLKYSTESIMKCYQDCFNALKENVEDTQNRVISNIAFAYTGVLLLSSIAGIEIEGLQDKVLDFAKAQIRRYESIKTPVDKVLQAIVALTDLGKLAAGIHFKIVDVDDETHIRFNKDTILSAINQFYASDKSKRINEDTFLSYAENHRRFRSKNHSVRYDNNKGRVVNSICFDISGMEDFVHISTHGVMPASYNETKQMVESKNTK